MILKGQIMRSPWLTSFSTLFGSALLTISSPALAQEGTLLAPPIPPTPVRVRFVSAKQNFEHVRQILLREHVGESVDEETLYRAATEGMLLSLNSGKRVWNKLLSPEEFRELENGINGQFAGIGVKIEFIEQTGTAIIQTVLPESPAEVAGLAKGDQILSVNGKVFRDKSMAKMVEEIRGHAGEKVSLKILRNDQVHEKDVTRAVVSWAPVKAKIENGVGHLNVRYFNKNTPKMVAHELEGFNKNKVKGIVLDLRKNSGGVFGDAVETADIFLPKGKIITHVVGRNHMRQVLISKHEPLTKLPVVVLVDESTSSGAELVAASLKENLGTKVIGKKTFGKWNAQNVRQLPNHFAIKYTVYEFRSPKDKTYHDVGLTPDVEIENPLVINSKKEAASPADNDKQLETAYHLLEKMI